MLEGRSLIAGDPDGTLDLATVTIVTQVTNGTAMVDALGAWTFRERDSPSPASATISVESSAGGILEGVPVDVQ